MGDNSLVDILSGDFVSLIIKDLVKINIEHRKLYC